MQRLIVALFWIALWGAAAIGVLFLGLAAYGLIDAAIIGCGPRSTWTEANYSACSDIDETNPIFLVLGLQAIAPLCFALFLRWLIRIARPDAPR